MFGFGSGFDLFCRSLFILDIAGWLLLRSRSVWKGKRFYFNMSNVNFASFAVDQREGCFHRVYRNTNLAGPNIGGTPRNNADNAVLPFGVHDTIDHVVKGTITTITN